jgi:hypothetical protein
MASCVAFPGSAFALVVAAGRAVVSDLGQGHDVPGVVELAVPGAGESVAHDLAGRHFDRCDTAERGERCALRPRRTQPTARTDRSMTPDELRGVTTRWLERTLHEGTGRIVSQPGVPRTDRPFPAKGQPPTGGKNATRVRKSLTPNRQAYQLCPPITKSGVTGTPSWTSSATWAAWK